MESQVESSKSEGSSPDADEKCTIFTPPAPPPLPPSLTRTFDSDSTFITKFGSIELPEYLRDYPFDLSPRVAHLASKNTLYETALEWVLRFCPPSSHIFSIELQICSLIQFGPTCGITAALMLLDLPACDVIPKTNQLVLQARELGYSTFGEMFIASHLAALIQHKLDINTQLMFNFRDNLKITLEHLLNYKPILIPYDYSAQFFAPGFDKGDKAHWAMLVGFCYNFTSLPFEKDKVDKNLLQLEEKFDSKSLSPEDTLKLILDYDFNPESLIFYGRHSKTNRVCIWKFDDLCRSNHELEIVADKYIFPGTSFVLPPNGSLRETLADHFILIDKQFDCHEDYF